VRPASVGVAWVVHVKAAYLKKGAYLHGPRPDMGSGTFNSTFTETP